MIALVLALVGATAVPKAAIAAPHSSVATIVSADDTSVAVGAGFWFARTAFNARWGPITS
ncbi:hypothetical protein [Agromyces seonyuensis]|uniref:Uncharacterized protein n=1 Tax=Agromyces seonyuensis TaxID=2662446 RepID=A0A6I4NW88_9MICO|nr:hypothetical protein [Agromyces seonyuensis]MWB98706.1 hypothetical protein [Agromyces seonyuensis]